MSRRDAEAEWEDATHLPRRGPAAPPAPDPVQTCRVCHWPARWQVATWALDGLLHIGRYCDAHLSMYAQVPHAGGAPPGFCAVIALMPGPHDPQDLGRLLCG